MATNRPTSTTSLLTLKFPEAIPNSLVRFPKLYHNTQALLYDVNRNSVKEVNREQATRALNND